MKIGEKIINLRKGNNVYFARKLIKSQNIINCGKVQVSILEVARLLQIKAKSESGNLSGVM